MRRRIQIDEPIADPEAARESALKLLERTRRTRADLERRLRDRGFTAPAIREALDRLAGVGLVDDVEYGRAYLAGRWGRRAAGWRRLSMELRRRGLSEQDVAQARVRLEAEHGAVDELSAARRTIAQAERRYRGLDARIRRQRLYGLLVRRGFDSDVIERALTGGEDDG